MGTGYKNRGSGAAGLGFKNRGAKLVEGAAYTNRGATDGTNETFKNRGQAWGSEIFYNRGPNDFASLSVLGLATFYAPLTHSLVLTRGTGSATYTRATKAWEFGYAAAANAGADQVLIEVATNTPRFGGARYDSGTWYNTYADGSAISASSLLGYHAEGARTNSLLWSRDLTNAAWVKTNITAAKTATGLDNAPNSASTLTAGAADATILQTLSLAAAERSFSAYVTRRTGVGPIYTTRDGFATEVDISGSLQVGSLADSTKRYRVKIENTTVDGPVVGFKIATSGDAIDVDVCQDEAYGVVTSPIITTTAAVTRNSELLDYATANVSANSTFAGTFYTQTLNNSAIQPIIGTKTNSTEGFGKLATTNKVYIAGSAEVATTTGSALTIGTFYKFAGTLNGTNRAISANGGAVTSAADASSWTASKLRVNGDGWGSASQGYLKNVYIWSTAFTDEQLQQVTA